MKFETIGNNKKKVKITLGIVCVVAIVGITAFTLTRASYKQTQSVPLIKGNISYNKSDLEIVAIKLQQDDGSYKDATSIPSSGYKLNTDISKSYCKVGSSTKLVDYKYDNGTWYFSMKETWGKSVMQKGAKCYLSFDKGEPIDFVQRILDDNGGALAIARKGTPDFSKAATTNEGMYAMEDDYGISYYFRGAVTNNYVKFGKHQSNYLEHSDRSGKDMYWRIIRINGDGTIRMIYDGSEYHPNGTVTDNSITDVDKQFNSNSNRNEYVGYKYILGEKRGSGGGNSKISSPWVPMENFTDNKFMADPGFCGDRTSTTTSGGVPNNTGGTGTTTTYYGAYYRLITKKEPTLRCATISYGSNSSYEKGSKLDLYTSFSTYGNPSNAPYITAGLITADEVAMAGGVFAASSGIANNKYYLYNGQNYWTMSPSRFGGDAVVFLVSYNGGLFYNPVNFTGNGVRPVINIDPSQISSVTVDSNGVYVIS